MCWNTAGTPTTGDSKTSDGTGTGVYASSLTGLAPGTTYHIRAYTTNAAATAYGAEQTFTTPPVITASAGDSTCTAGIAPTTVDPAITIQSADFADLTVSITAGFQSVVNDTLSYTGVLPAGVTASYDMFTGVLTFTGTASAAQWQVLARTVTFSTGAVNDSALGRSPSAWAGAFSMPAMGISTSMSRIQGAIWTDAKAAAAASTLFGLQGYLATITSQQENDLIDAMLGGGFGGVWIGASDDFSQINAAAGHVVYGDQAASEGNWYWVTGPEAGTRISSGNDMPVPVNGAYLNWMVGEPNNENGMEHSAQMVKMRGLERCSWNGRHVDVYGVRVCCRVRQ